MRLRRQLLLVSLLTLALPWAGCEYIREMEKTLRQGQQAALQATAQAVAARLANDPATQALLAPPERPTPADSTLYAHPLPARLIVDGYSDDWRQLGLQAQVFEAEQPGFHVRIQAGQYDKELFLFIRVRDESVAYHSPLKSAEVSDHLLLWLAPDTAPVIYHLFTGAPGQVSVVESDSDSREHRIRGVWQEWEMGYQLELRLPLEWAETRFGLAVHNAQTAAREDRITTADTPANAPPLALREPALDQALAVFTGPADSGILLRLAGKDGWIVGQSGAHAPPAPVRLEGDALLTRLYRLILGQQTFPTLNNPESTGRFTANEVDHALGGENAAHWYASDGQQVARVAVPVTFAGGVAAAVVAEQTTDTLRAMTDSAFSRLVSYSLAAFAVTGLGLIAYASWLSWRIQRLSRAAEQAVDSQGRIGRKFPQSNSVDEIGDLSRRYGELLERLNQHNTYLETLASKLSHELRTPLAVVRSSLDNLEQHSLPAEAAVYSARAQEGAERLSHILTAMSAASRVEQSIHVAELETVDMKRLLADLTDAYAGVYASVRWTFAADEGEYVIAAAPDLLVQMLDKLADNAADFAPTGSTVEITLARAERALLLQVSNPGPPLPQTMQGQLFDSLVSVREERGTGHHLGLGLYIVRLIAEFHGGTVTGRNREDSTGAVFTVTLPANRHDH